MNGPAAANKRNLVAACAAISVFGFAFGMTYPLLSLILEARGVSSDMIGINSAMLPIGILLFSPVIPIFASRFGARNVAITAAITTALVILGYKVFDTLSAWFLIRLVQGMTIATLFVLSEAWIVGSAGDRNRGKIVAIYSSVLSASFGAGPLLISFIGIEGWLPFVLGAIVVVLGVIPFIFIREDAHGEPEETRPSGIMRFAQKAPMLLAAVGAFAIFDAATLSLFPVYGVQNGLDLATASNVLTALILGNVLLQFPIGWLCDRFAPRLVMAGCALLTTLSLLLLPLVITSNLKWPLLVLMGTTGYGVYTVALVSLGSRFRGIELINGSASFAVIWGFGALLGSVSGGLSMLASASHGLPLSLAVVYLVLAVGVAWRQYSLKHRAAREPGHTRL